MPNSNEEIRQFLIARQAKLLSIIQRGATHSQYSAVLGEIDSALQRLEHNEYGTCEVCHEVISTSDLHANPLLRKCISHLPTDQQLEIYKDKGVAEVLTSLFQQDDVRGASLEQTGEPSSPKTINFTPWIGENSQDINLDITRARLVQAELLPESHVRHETWDIFYEYIPAGALSGDYCDLVRKNPGDIFLFIGDAMGKGITACMIASRLHTLFRTLLDLTIPLAEMLDRANRIFCECILTSNHYATVVCSRATPTGTLELVNAGHVPPLVLRANGVEQILESGLPLGMFFDSKYKLSSIQLEPGETLLCYTDGLNEARDAGENEYGHQRVTQLAAASKHLPPEELVRVCREDVAAYTSKSSFSDDLTLMALRRTG
jgi:phosphoserine phosphatase RsbU/P